MSAFRYNTPIANAAVQSHGSKLVAVLTLWSSPSGADIEEIHESSDNPFLVEQLHGVTPQKHTVNNHSVFYKPEKVNVVITATISIDCGWKIPSLKLLLVAPEYFLQLLLANTYLYFHQFTLLFLHIWFWNSVEYILNVIGLLVTCSASFFDWMNQNIT